MATKLGTILADFRTSFATRLAVGGTSATLQSVTDDDGVALPSGLYYFTIDGDNGQKEHIQCSLSGTSLTAIQSVSRQGVLSSGSVRDHRIGATVTITNFAHILFIGDLLDGSTNLDATAPLAYDAAPTLTVGSNELATVVYADGLAIAGAPDATITGKGIFEKATDAELQSSAADGSGGTTAPLAATSTSFNQTSTANKVPVANSSGVIDDGYVSLTTEGDILYRNATGLARLAKGTAGQVLAVNSGATAPEWVGSITAVDAATLTDGSQADSLHVHAALAQITASDNTKQSADTERTKFSDVNMTQVKEIQVYVQGTLRTYYEIRRGATNINSFSSRIYINGVATGSTHIANNPTYVSFTDDLVVSPGDLVQLYYGSGNLNDVFVQNFRLRYDIGTSVESVVNTD